MFGRKKAIDRLVAEATNLASSADLPSAMVTFSVELATAAVRKEIRSTDDLDRIFGPITSMPTDRRILFSTVWTTFDWPGLSVGPGEVDPLLTAHVASIVDHMRAE